MADEMGPLPPVHLRVRVAHNAAVELDQFLADWKQRNALTSAEYAMLVSRAAFGFAARLVAIERRPLPEQS